MIFISSPEKNIHLKKTFPVFVTQMFLLRKIILKSYLMTFPLPPETKTVLVFIL